MHKNDYEKIVYEALTQQHSPEAGRALYNKYCADDCVWENTGFPDAAGLEQINGLLDTLYTGGYYKLDQTVTNMRSSDRLVMAERYEKMLREDGSVICEFKIVGVFEFNDEGALPSLRAATDASVKGGEYYGPNRMATFRGAPVAQKSSRRSQDLATASRLWQVAEEQTGVHYLSAAA